MHVMSLSRTTRRELSLVCLVLVLSILMFWADSWLHRLPLHYYPGLNAEWLNGFWHWAAEKIPWADKYVIIVCLIPLGILVDRCGPFKSLGALIAIFAALKILLLLQSAAPLVLPLFVLSEIARFSVTALLVFMIVVVLIRGIRPAYFARYIMLYIPIFFAAKSATFYPPLSLSRTMAADDFRVLYTVLILAVGLYLLYPRGNKQTAWRRIDGASVSTFSDLDLGRAFRSPFTWAPALAFSLIAFAAFIIISGYIRFQMGAFLGMTWDNVYGAGNADTLSYLILILTAVAGLGVYAYCAYLTDKTQKFDLVLYGYFGVITAGYLLIASALFPFKAVLYGQTALGLISYCVLGWQYKLLTFARPLKNIATICAIAMVVTKAGREVFVYFFPMQPTTTITEIVPGNLTISLYVAIALSLAAIPVVFWMKNLIQQRDC